MSRFRARVSYDGGAYLGWQRQREPLPTVQRAIEMALEAVLQVPVRVIAAGRTDTGVHATGQVIAFDADWPRDSAELLRALNALLPADIALQSLERAHAAFHPRFDALSRSYGYTVLQAPQPQPLRRNHVWYLRASLDLDALNAAAALLIGEHDFATFGTAPDGDNTVRRVYVSTWGRQPVRDGWLYRYQVEATAFLYHMVRRMVALQVAVGSGRMTLKAFEAAFLACDLSQAKAIAPPQGLVLEKVRYNNHDR